MKYQLMLGICFTFMMYSFTNSNSSMSIQVKDHVSEFSSAIEKRDVAALDNLLHENFRVVANQYPTSEKLTILTKEVYLQLIESKKIGGTKYEVKFDYISVEDHSATVVAKFQGETSSMYLTLLLINNNDKWSIIEDLALIK